MKKETYAFIIGTVIGYNVKKFMEKPVNRVTERIINNAKKKVADEMYRVLMGGTPEEVLEARKRVNYTKDHDLREWKHKVDYRKIGKNNINEEKKKEFLDEISLYFCDNPNDEDFIREIFEEVFEK